LARLWGLPLIVFAAFVLFVRLVSGENRVNLLTVKFVVHTNSHNLFFGNCIQEFCCNKFLSFLYKQ
jgi:hypothetical protein